MGWTAMYLRDHSSGKGGITGYNQGLNQPLAGYNGVFRFPLTSYKADIFWLGVNYFGDPLFQQGRFGYNGFSVLNLGVVDGAEKNVDVLGFATNLRVAYKYGRTADDMVSLDGIFTTGDNNSISDGKYNGVLTGNNWTSPGAVFFSHNLYLLMAHGTVVNRYVGATIDIQNLGYGLTAGVLAASKDIIPNKFRIKSAIGFGKATKVPAPWGNYMGTEVNLNVLYRPKVFLDLELHAAYLKLGGYYDNPSVNGGRSTRPDDPWTMFATLKWILF